MRDVETGSGAFATEAGTGSETVETIAAQLLTFGPQAIHALRGEV